MMPQQEANNFE